jgi:hypothetical protein
LEVTLLTTLLTFQDMSTGAANNESSVIPSPHVHLQAEATAAVAVAAAPPVPPRPAPKTGVDRVAEMHAMRYEPNEVTVDGEGSVENYGEYAEGLLAVCLGPAPPARPDQTRPLIDAEPPRP